MRSAAALVSIFLMAAVLPSAGAATHKVIFDTDFLMPPQDDGSALVLALNSPGEIEVVGITIVAGNHNLETEAAHALRLLELMGREDIPVYAGAAKPLQHKKSDYAVIGWGKWWLADPPEEPAGGFAKRKKLEDAGAVDYIVKTVIENPGKITILAVGPLTNIALAIRREPRFAASVKRMVIMDQHRPGHSPGAPLRRQREADGHHGRRDRESPTARAIKRRTPNSTSGWTPKPPRSSCARGSRSLSRR